MCAGPEIALVIQGGMAVAGLVTGAKGAKTTMQGQKEQATASKEAEMLRKEQMELETARKKRQLIRQAQTARATSVSRATAQGVGISDSAVQGSLGQVSQDFANNTGFENQAARIGRGIFDANARYAEAGAKVAMGQGITSIGSSLLRSSGMAGSILGSLLFGNSEASQARGGLRELGSGGAP